VAQGRRVWLADLDEAAAQRPPRRSVPGLRPGRHLWRTPAAAWPREVDAEAGLALWVNNAGVLFTRPSWEHPAGEVRTMLDVNVRGTMHGTWAALPPMRARGAGHVVNVVSLAGLAAPPVRRSMPRTSTRRSLSPRERCRTCAPPACAGSTSPRLPRRIWTPMLHDKLDDPHAAAPGPGVMLTPEQVAAQVARVVQRPRPITSVPGWRGGMCRVYSATPRVALATRPLLLAVARRNQKAFAKSHPRPAG
jgi:NAD(P)-dependent dehydrogenase (short-subunit alcohol dehydrogenase family)